MKYTKNEMQVTITLTFVCGLLAGIAVAILVATQDMKKMSEEWQWRVEREQADHMETAKALQEVRASWAAGVKANF